MTARIVWSRRKLLHAGGGALALALARPWRSAEACGAAQSCAPTHPDIEGPYYRAGAPLRWDLTEPGTKGVPLDLEGRVIAADCRSPLRDAELDVWQADGDGHYDNDGSTHGRGMRLRGRVRTDGDGRYRIRSVLPGHYLNGAQFRPAHVHVKLRAKDHAPLTTQLYFPGDPYNAIDPFMHPSLLMDVKKSDGRLRAHFDFVLRQSASRT